MDKQKYIVLTLLALTGSTLILPVLETHFSEKNYTEVLYGYEFMFIYPLIAINCALAYYIPFEDKTKGWVLWSVAIAFFVLFLLVMGFAFSFSPGGAQFEEHLAIGSWVLLSATIVLFGYSFYCLLKTKSVQK
ncbi:MAG: hypothetical protein HYZ43_09820 [Flavobacteriia bacterium]|nr:hypothetical protein [Flavobacteriia bacterium]